MYISEWKNSKKLVLKYLKYSFIKKKSDNVYKFQDKKDPIG